MYRTSTWATNIHGLLFCRVCLLYGLSIAGRLVILEKKSGWKILPLSWWLSVKLIIQSAWSQENLAAFIRRLSIRLLCASVIGLVPAWPRTQFRWGIGGWRSEGALAREFETCTGDRLGPGLHCGQTMDSSAEFSESGYRIDQHHS